MDTFERNIFLTGPPQLFLSLLLIMVRMPQSKEQNNNNNNDNSPDLETVDVGEPVRQVVQHGPGQHRQRDPAGRTQREDDAGPQRSSDGYEPLHRHHQRHVDRPRRRRPLHRRVRDRLEDLDPRCQRRVVEHLVDVKDEDDVIVQSQDDQQVSGGAPHAAVTQHEDGQGVTWSQRVFRHGVGACWLFNNPATC